MRITSNAAPHTFADNATVASLIEQIDLASRRPAVELNEEVVPRRRYVSASSALDGPFV